MRQSVTKTNFHIKSSEHSPFPLTECCVKLEKGMPGSADQE